MAKIQLEKIDEVFFRLRTEGYIHQELSDYFKFRQEGFQFTPSYKNRLWDGYVRLYNMMDCTLPIGLLNYLKQFCKERDYTLDYESDSSIEVNLDKFNEFIDNLKLPFELRDYQVKGIKHVIENNRTLLLSPTGSGKSATIYTLTRWFNTKTLIIVPTLSLIHQMKSDFSDYAVNDKTFNTDREIHLVYGGQDKNTNKNIIVGTWQSLYKLPKVWFEQFDVIICDEAHLGKSASITSILKKTSNTKIKIGTTGTLDGTKVNQLILEGYLGPVFSVISTKELIDNNFLAKLSIHCICLKYPEYECKLMKETTYDEEVKYIIKHERRNRFITNLTKTLNDTTLILFEFVDDHGKILHSMIEKSIKNRNVYFVYGGTPSEEREEIRKKVENERGSIIVASVKVFSTGVNIKNLDNIIFVSPTKSRIRSLQSIGRVLRIGDYSNKANLYDIVDDFSYKNRKNYALKHFLERAKVYDSEKFDYKIHKVVF